MKQATIEGRKPKVVFDPKMPTYQFRQGEDRSMSVDRKRNVAERPSADCLSNLTNF